MNTKRLKGTLEVILASSSFPGGLLPEKGPAMIPYQVGTINSSLEKPTFPEQLKLHHLPKSKEPKMAAKFEEFANFVVSPSPGIPPLHHIQVGCKKKMPTTS